MVVNLIVTLLTGHIFLLLLCVSMHNDLVSGQKHLSVSYDTHGQYKIQVDNMTWLTGAQTYFTVNAKTFTTADGSLKLTNMTKSRGFDRIGTWQSVSFWYKASDIVIEAFIKTYDELDAVVFGQHFPNGSTGMSVGDRYKLSSAFPNFKIPASGGSAFELGYLAYGGLMVGELKQRSGRFEQKRFRCANGVEGGPLVLFDSKGNATIISSFSNFMVGVPYKNNMTWEYGWGLQGELQSVPMGFVYETTIFYGKGIRGAFDNWGFNMRRYYGKSTDLRDSDFTNNYLSYWTDNGAYYVQYYARDYLIQNMTYEESLIKYKECADKAGIPFRSMQYSVWYITQGQMGPTITYEPYNKSMPHGLDYMRDHIKLPITSHNRYWSPNTTYAKQNGGKYNFIVETKGALPQDQQFWTDLFNQMKRWEFGTFMQDWLEMPPTTMNGTVSDPFVLRNWLLQMGRGASENDMTIQYCMSLPMHILQSLEIPSVTQARASNDYNPNADRFGNEQWKIGISSLFADAMGIAPFKDTFWTTSNQTGNHYNGSEAYPALQAAVSSLSAGPVGPGDMINGTNATLLMRCCNADGLLLKPARPARIIDDQLIQATLGSLSSPIGPIGEVWTTYTEIGEYAFGIIFAADIHNNYNITPMKAFHSEDKFMSYAFSDEIPVYVRNFSEENPLSINRTCTKADFCLFYATPIIKLASREIYLLGEFGKWVPMSAKRFTEITVTDTDMYISVVGSPDEQVGFHFVYLDKLGYTYVWLDCHLSDAGTATIDIVKHRCY